jgi:chromate transporter
MTRHERNESRPGVPLRTVGLLWLRLGCIGFGGPPTHISLLRRMCVDERKWIPSNEFEDAISTCNLLPGPASTQLAIYCAWRVQGVVGGLLGGVCFILPGLVLIIGLSAVFLARHPPTWILGAAAGAGAAVPAVALYAARGLAPGSWRRIGTKASQRIRWVIYALLGVCAADLIGPYLVVILLACGVAEIMFRRAQPQLSTGSVRGFIPAIAMHGVAMGGFGALAWVALKVGALSYGGGFVIVPLMQHDAVTTYHWMTGTQFLDAVALGQVTPGPVVQTVAVVGYAARGLGGALLAALIAFAPSFIFVLFGGRHFEQIRSNKAVEAFLTGAGPAVIGAIAGSSIPLGLALHHLWQIPVLAGGLAWIFIVRRGVVSTLLIAGVIGVVVALAGAPI